MHYADLTATTTWQDIDPVATPLTLRNQGTNRVRLSKGDAAPDGPDYGILLNPLEALKVGANQRIWYRCDKGTNAIAVTDLE